MKFIILANARSGSTLLCKSLNSHPNLKVECELLHPEFDEMINWRQKRNCQSYYQSMDYELLLNEIYNHVDGFKVIHINNVDTVKLRSAIEKQNIFCIILKRENIVNSVISLYVARLYHTWQNYNFKPKTKVKEKIYIDPSGFLNEIHKIENFFNAFNDINVNKLEIRYEDLISKWDETIKLICDNINCPYVPLSMKIDKLIDDNHHEFIRNYKDLKNFFKETKYYQYFR